jgi:hypothetical protein
MEQESEKSVNPGSQMRHHEEATLKSIDPNFLGFWRIIAGIPCGRIFFDLDKAQLDYASGPTGLIEIVSMELPAIEKPD